MDLQQFGSTIKTKYPQYKDYSDEEIGQKMLQKYPQYQSQITQPQRTNPLQQVGEFLAPETTKTLTTLPQKLAQKQASLPNAKGNLEQSISNAATMTGELAKGTVGNPGIWMEGALNMGGGVLGKGAAIAAGKGAKLLALLAKYPTLRRAGKALEAKAVQAGEVPAELIAKHLDINKLVKGTSTASNMDKQVFTKKALEEITSVQPGLAGKSTDAALKEAPNTYAKMLEYRVNAGNKGYPGRGVAKSPENIYYKNLQRAYSNILKEGAGTKDLDKINSLLQGINKHKKLIGGVAGTAIVYKTIYDLLNRLPGKSQGY